MRQFYLFYAKSAGVMDVVFFGDIVNYSLYHEAYSW